MRPLAGAGDGRVSTIMDVNLSGVGPRLRELRLERGYTLREAARRSGVSRAHINNLENSPQANPTIAVLLRLQAAYRVGSVEALLGDLPSQRAVVLVNQ